MSENDSSTKSSSTAWIAPASLSLYTICAFTQAPKIELHQKTDYLSTYLTKPRCLPWLRHFELGRQVCDNCSLIRSDSTHQRTQNHMASSLVCMACTLDRRNVMGQTSAHIKWGIHKDVNSWDKRSSRDQGRENSELKKTWQWLNWPLCLISTLLL